MNSWRFQIVWLGYNSAASNEKVGLQRNYFSNQIPNQLSHILEHQNNKPKFLKTERQ